MVGNKCNFTPYNISHDVVINLVLAVFFFEIGLLESLVRRSVSKIGISFVIFGFFRLDHLNCLQCLLFVYCSFLVKAFTISIITRLNPFFNLFGLAEIRGISEVVAL